MYHKVTNKDKRRAHVWLAVLLAVLVAVSVALGMLLRSSQDNARDQGAVALRKSILDAAVRCCAIEGSYPLSITHLEQSYGLRINHDDYVVTYEAYAGNVVPSVVVVPR